MKQQCSDFAFEYRKVECPTARTYTRSSSARLWALPARPCRRYPATPLRRRSPATPQIQGHQANEPSVGGCDRPRMRSRDSHERSVSDASQTMPTCQDHHISANLARKSAGESMRASKLTRARAARFNLAGSGHDFQASLGHGSDKTTEKRASADEESTTAKPLAISAFMLGRAAEKEQARLEARQAGWLGIPSDMRIAA